MSKMLNTIRQWLSHWRHTGVGKQPTRTELLLPEQLTQTVLFDRGIQGIALLSLDGTCLQSNTTFNRLLGYTKRTNKKLNFFHLLNKADLLALESNTQELLMDKIADYKANLQCKRENGEWVWLSIVMFTIKDQTNQPANYLLQILDYTLEREAKERLHHMAYHDPLTGLGNRNMFEQNLNHVLANCQRSNESFAILYLDIDNLKDVNDSVGHDAGDTLINVLGDRLKNVMRSIDMIARIGGDEFVIIVRDIKKIESAGVIATKILSVVNNPITINAKELFATVSIGISIYPFDGKTTQELLKNADMALYKVKQSGGNGYQFYTSEMTEKARHVIELKKSIMVAMDKNELELHYQPQMDIKTRKIVGVEALLRWNNADYGMISPDELIATAEEAGGIVKISQWIMKTACQQLKLWHHMGLTDLTMSVNISAKPFTRPGFIDGILSILHASGLSPRSMMIEVTEQTIMTNPDELLHTLYLLKDMGFALAIDDFGCGYWSLNHFRRIAIDKIKIDKTFTHQLDTDRSVREIVAAMIAMTKKLNIVSLAEGVESKNEYHLLKEMGCDEIQGYYLSRPAQPAIITEYLKHPIPDAEVISS